MNTDIFLRFVNGIDGNCGFYSLSNRDLKISYYKNFTTQFEEIKVKLSKKDFNIINKYHLLSENEDILIIDDKILSVLVPYFINKYKKP